MTDSPKMPSSKEALEDIRRFYSEHGKCDCPIHKVKAAIPVAELHGQAMELLDKIHKHIINCPVTKWDINELLNKLKALK